MYRFLIYIFFIVPLYAETLHEQVARMLIVGLPHADSQKLHFFQTAAKYPLGGVILFGKDLQTQKQVHTLNKKLQTLHRKKLLIGIDQEGGYVDRLAKLPSVPKTPSAAEIAKMPIGKAQNYYTQTAQRLKYLGFTLNFAPVVDLAINPKNRVIVGFQRSYGKSVMQTVKYATLYINAMDGKGIIPVIKHFPGHGSSVGDSHEGFTDVSETWEEEELLPYVKLIQAGKARMIMSAHIYNKYLDKDYPATLSYKTITGLLRKKLGFEGVVISDDMQMGAIRDNYSQKDAIVMAINAGVDMLLFGNQLQKAVLPDRLIDMIVEAVREGLIKKERIEDANRHIASLLQEKGD